MRLSIVKTNPENIPNTYAPPVKQSSDITTTHFVNNRPEALFQRQIQQFAQNSPQVQKIAQLQSKVTTYTQQKHQIPKSTAIINTPSVVQRMLITSIGKDTAGNDVVKVKTDNRRRPSTGLPRGSQGDHTTPYAVLQDQLKNAMAELSLPQAWDALEGTYNVYKTLPGWGWLLRKFDPLKDDVETRLANKGSVYKLREAANEMLSLRQKVPYTNVPKGGVGNAEGHWLSGIRDGERKLQLNLNAKLHKSFTKKNVIFDMIRVLDWKRLKRMRSENRVKNILKQHAITIVDAYPLLCDRLKINRNHVYKMTMAYYIKFK